MLGGSHAYGLNTASSDLDKRGVFCNLEINKVIGLDRFEHQDIKIEGKDEFYFELRHFLCSLRKTNTQALEILFNNQWLDIEPEFEMIIQNRFELLDSAKLYKSLKGYIFGERRLVNGEKKGLLGAKRREALEKYGYSFKNAVQCLRLCWAGRVFFTKGYFPVNIPKEDKGFGQFLMEIKTRPDKFPREAITVFINEEEHRLDYAFDNRTVDYRFNEKIANQICLDIYYPIIKSINQKLHPVSICC